jgi:hypothetical protein
MGSCGFIVRTLSVGSAALNPQKERANCDDEVARRSNASAVQNESSDEVCLCSVSGIHIFISISTKK